MSHQLIRKKKTNADDGTIYRKHVISNVIQFIVYTSFTHFLNNKLWISTNDIHTYYLSTNTITKVKAVTFTFLINQTIFRKRSSYATLLNFLGFSLGDELGFKESISNTEINRRRSAQSTKFQVAAVQAQQGNVSQSVNKRSEIQNDVIPGK